MKVHIPFLARFEEPLLSGTKIMTSRSKKYGDIGDTFETFGATFRLTEVFTLPLGNISVFWREEGCKSLEDFIETWKRIHPKVGYNPEAVYWVHIFHLEGVKIV